MMNLVNIVSNALVAQQVGTAIKAQPIKTSTNNPFANPFVSDYHNNSQAKNFYGKNAPVKGGYFAGYYNGKPNIVGQRLFIEV